MRWDYFFVRAAKIGRVPSPLEWYDKAGPMRTFVGRQGQGQGEGWAGDGGGYFWD